MFRVSSRVRERNPSIPIGLFAPFVIVFLVLFVLSASVKVLREHERAVPFTLGRFSAVRGSGLVLIFHVIDAAKSVIQVEQFIATTRMLAQTTLRSVLGQHNLDEMLTARAKLNVDV